MKHFIAFGAAYLTLAVAGGSAEAGFVGFGTQNGEASVAFFSTPGLPGGPGIISLNQQPVPIDFNYAYTQAGGGFDLDLHMDGDVFGDTEDLGVGSLNADLTAAGVPALGRTSLYFSGDVSTKDRTALPSGLDNAYYYAATNYSIFGTLAAGDLLNFSFQTYILAGDSFLFRVGTGFDSLTVDSPGDFRFDYIEGLTPFGAYYSEAGFPAALADTELFVLTQFRFELIKGDGGGTSSVHLRSGGSTDIYSYDQPLSVVPEPSSFAMTASSVLLGLLVVRLRRARPVAPAAS